MRTCRMPFLMYRVELKALKRERRRRYRLLFLMYRVELKVHQGQKLCQSLCGFLMYRVELKVNGAWAVPAWDAINGVPNVPCGVESPKRNLKL